MLMDSQMKRGANGCNLAITWEAHNNNNKKRRNLNVTLFFFGLFMYGFVLFFFPVTIILTVA